jgi:hypothetical protein
MLQYFAKDITVTSFCVLITHVCVKHFKQKLLVISFYNYYKFIFWVLCNLHKKSVQKSNTHVSKSKSCATDWQVLKLLQNTLSQKLLFIIFPKIHTSHEALIRFYEYKKSYYVSDKYDTIYGTASLFCQLVSILAVHYIVFGNGNWHYWRRGFFCENHLFIWLSGILFLDTYIFVGVITNRNSVNWIVFCLRIYRYIIK